MSAKRASSPWMRFAGEMIVPMLLLGYATHYYISVGNLPRRQTNLLLIEPAYWLLLVCCVIFAGFKQREAIAASRASGSAAATGAGPDGPSEHDRIDPFRATAFVLLTGLYIWMIPTTGFVSATLGYTLLMLLVLGVRTWPVLLLVPSVLTAVLWIGMDHLLNLRLPRGIFF